jgi:GDP-4-dehydro-6-deoxy-D-mannose reductase
VSDVVLITGARGFAGGHLVEHLASSHRIVAWTRSSPPEELAGLAQWDRIDLLDRDRVRSAIASLRPSRVYHCAGMPNVAESFRDTAAGLEANVLASEHLFDALRRADVRCRVLVTSSAAVYAASEQPISEDHTLAPASPYALSKLAQEELARRAASEDGLDIVIARAFNHTGPRQTAAFVAPGIARQIALIETGTCEPIIRVGNIAAKRDITDVRDVVRAYAALMTSGVSGMVYNVASGTARSIRSLLDELIARSKVPVQVETEPARMRPNDVPVLVGDSSRLERATGWRPTISFDRMLDDLLAYWRQQNT